VGRVQGVFFRAHTADEAQMLGLDGWVRNRSDGSVEVVAEGPRDALRQLAVWCHAGSPGAVVQRVDEAWEPPEPGDLGGFSIRY